ncbi:MAG: hypothetical protein HY907_13845 [Deltaproteobacteria bacterium]|nr:hypothetical protein [Deltaproteobacteria bacterium]
MTLPTRIALAAPLALALGLGCAEDVAQFGEPELPPEGDDLVSETDGKADTGYLSTLATELEGEFAGQVLLDVSTLGEAERSEYLARLQTTPYEVKNLVMDQVKFSKNRLNTEKLHMNLYTDRVEATEIVLDGTTIRVGYKVRLESVVSHEELEKAGLSIEQILASPATALRLPADPRNVFARAAERCATGFDAGGLADYNYFYYFDPAKAGCDLSLVDATFTVSSLAPPAQTTYPEYDRLRADNKLTVFVVFNASEHEATVSDSDWGVREWRQFRGELTSRGFSKTGELTPGERFRRVKGGIEELIDLVSPRDMHDAADSDAVFRAGIAGHEVVMYNGHSFYGSLNVLRDCSVYPADTYQVFFMSSCWSYEYYTRQIFECRKTAGDAFGWDLADVVNDTQSGWFHNMAEFSRILLTNLLAGVETGGKDGRRFYTWFNVVAAMNEHAVDIFRSWNTETHEIIGVSGVRNNRYDPEARPGSEGARYAMGTAIPIPDDVAAGIDSELVVTAPVVPSRITVGVNITHPYIGDLNLVLRRGTIELPLQETDRDN